MSLAGTIVLVYHLCFSRISAGLPWRWKRLFLCAENWIPIPTHARITWSSSGFHTCVAFISLAQCHGSGVPIDHVQEKVGGVVVGLALVACGDSDTVVTGVWALGGVVWLAKGCAWLSGAQPHIPPMEQPARKAWQPLESPCFPEGWVALPSSTVSKSKVAAGSVLFPALARAFFN